MFRQLTVKINFDFLSFRGTAVSVVSFANVIWSQQARNALSLQRGIDGVV